MNVKKFYTNDGWRLNKKNITIDAEIFEDNRKVASSYVSKCRLRIARYIPIKGRDILDFASGPIQYKEYLKYSKNFKFRHCVDFSKKAILDAKKKIGKKGKFYNRDFFNIKFKEDFFDCIISLHTIYHIKKNLQKKAVEKLIYSTKKGCPIIIVYSNPNTLINKLKKIINFKARKKKNQLYFYCHDIKWWFRFKKIASIKMYPWRSFSAQHQKLLMPSNIIGKIIFKILFILEDKFQNFFISNFQYYTVVLVKN